MEVEEGHTFGRPLDLDNEKIEEKHCVDATEQVPLSNVALTNGDNNVFGGSKVDADISEQEIYPTTLPNGTCSRDDVLTDPLLNDTTISTSQLKSIICNTNGMEIQIHGCLKKALAESSDLDAEDFANQMDSLINGISLIDDSDSVNFDGIGVDGGNCLNLIANSNNSSQFHDLPITTLTIDVFPLNVTSSESDLNSVLASTETCQFVSNLTKDFAKLSHTNDEIVGTATVTSIGFEQIMEVDRLQQVVLGTQLAGYTTLSPPINNYNPVRSDYADDSNVMVNVWTEFRSAVRQLNRSLVPSSARSQRQIKPSMTRIQALANMLIMSDPHQLYLRISQLMQELCIELKVRLLSNIQDEPSEEEAVEFVNGLSNCYQSFMSVCESLQPALERLDLEHLSRFQLKWMTVNMHLFHATVATDPDVQEYLLLCTTQLVRAPSEILSCLESLQKTLALGESAWLSAEPMLQDYRVECLAVTARKQQLLSEWHQFKQHQKQVESGTDLQIPPQCSCSDCLPTLSPPASAPPMPSGASSVSPPISPSLEASTAQCECHFCTVSPLQSWVNEDSLLMPVPNVSLPFVAPPQLALYPHIHGPSAGSNFVTLPSEESVNGLLLNPSKLHLENSLLENDLLTQQLIQEWDLLYGDDLAPPLDSSTNQDSPFFFSNQKASFLLSSVEGIENLEDQSQLVDDLELLRLGSSPLPSVTVTLKQEMVSSAASSQQSASKNEASGEDLTNDIPVSLCERVKNYSTASGIHIGCHKKIPTEEEVEEVCESVPDSDEASDSLSERDEASGEDSDSYSSSHSGAHCSCCYCHSTHQKQGSGGRQKYRDRRERLLQLLSRKQEEKAAACAPSSTSTSESRSSGSSCRGERSRGSKKGEQSIDNLVNFIEGDKYVSDIKTQRRSRRKTKKVPIPDEKSLKKIESSDSEELSDFPPDEHAGEEHEEEELEGPLAELRRRAPDVTITVVRPGQGNVRVAATHKSHDMSPPPEGSTPPQRYQQTRILQTESSGNTTFPRPVLHASRHSLIGQVPSNYYPDSSTPASPPPTGRGLGGLSGLLQSAEALGIQGGAKDKGGSQMVTIRRVMDPMSAEPTVTITLKGEEPDQDKVLFKLVNGQAANADKKNQQQQKQPGTTSRPQRYEQPLNIEGLTSEEIKRLRKKQKRERQRMQKEEDELKQEEEEKETLRQRQESLRVQQEKIKQQQAMLRRQEEDLLKQQQAMNSGVVSGVPGTAKKKKKGIAATAQPHPTGGNLAAQYGLSSGVSISQSATHPGMVTITNNMVAMGVGGGGMMTPSAGPVGLGGYSWGGSGGGRNEVVKEQATKEKTKMEMTSDEIVEAAVKGLIDFNSLNMTQKKKFKKAKKEIQEAKERAQRKQKEEDDLMDLEYRLAVEAAEAEKNLAKKEANKPPVVPYIGSSKKQANASNAKSAEGKRNGLEKKNTMSQPVVIPAIKTASQASNPVKVQPIQGKKNQAKVVPTIPHNETFKSVAIPSKQLLNSNTVQKKINKKEVLTQVNEVVGKGKKEVLTQVNEVVGKGNNSQPQNFKFQSKPFTSTQRQRTPVPNKKEIFSANSHKETMKNVRSESSPHVQTLVNKVTPLQKTNQQQGKDRINPSQKLTQLGNVHSKPTINGVNQTIPNQFKQPSFSHPSGNQFKQSPVNQFSQSNRNQFNPSSLIQSHQQVRSNEALTKTPSTNFIQPPLQYRPKPVVINGSHSTAYPTHSTSVALADERQYRQYVAANAESLAGPLHRNSSVCQRHDEVTLPVVPPVNLRKRNRRKGGSEELSTIESVFHPKEVEYGGAEELDQTERDVEAFKRFCFDNVPRQIGQKPKVNFNVKDILFKKRSAVNSNTSSSM